MFKDKNEEEEIKIKTKALFFFSLSFIFNFLSFPFLNSLLQGRKLLLKSKLTLIQQLRKAKLDKLLQHRVLSFLKTYYIPKEAMRVITLLVLKLSKQTIYFLFSSYSSHHHSKNQQDCFNIFVISLTIVVQRILNGIERWF